MDNCTAVAYVNKRCGTKSSTLAELAVELWAVCHQNNIWITAQHLPGTQNVDADWASRHFNERTEWTLDKSIFTRMVRKFYTPQVDLFASRLNHQLPKYVSRHPDPGAMSVDARNKTGRVPEVSPSTVTLWWRRERKSLNQRCGSPLIPNFRSFIKRRSCLTLSNVFAKSW